MSAHTPGPWKVYENPRTWNDLGRETFPNAEPPAPELLIGTAWDHPQLKGPDLIVTTVHGPYYDPPVTVCITPANARLIAAAPRLLEALLGLCEAISQPITTYIGETTYAEMCGLDTEYSEARAAIAEAIGGEP